MLIGHAVCRSRHARTRQGALNPRFGGVEIAVRFRPRDKAPEVSPKPDVCSRAATPRSTVAGPATLTALRSVWWFRSACD